MGTTATVFASACAGNPSSPHVIDLANLTIYDAAYVALAEALDTALLTARRLAEAPGARCAVEVLA